MTNHLGALAQEATALYGKPAARVLDIGCNDGTLLKSYPATFAKFGVDPSDLANEVPAGITVVHDLFPSDELYQALDGKLCDIVTSIAMFYDLEDPIAFARAIKRVLSPDGLWCVEMSYMPTMLRMTSYDTICHEHLEYYSLAVLEHIMRQADLRLVNVSLNASNGGSIRCYATHADNLRYRRDEFASNIKRLRQEEFDLELDTDKPYRQFPGARERSQAGAPLAAARGCAPRASASTLTAPRPRATPSSSGAESTAGSSTSRPNATRTSSARARSARTFPSSARRSLARPSRTTTWCCPGTFATSSSNVRRRCSPRASA